MTYLTVFVSFLVLASASLGHKGRDSFVFPSNVQTEDYPLKIVGGEQALPKQFPFQVALYIDYQSSSVFCGGSLISRYYVLTAAHCALGAISIEVVLGAYNISDKSDPNQQRQTVTSYVVHTGWDSKNLVNDIALVKLSTPAVLTEYVQITPIAIGGASYADSEGTATGWGKQSDVQTTVTDILRYETNKVMNNIECKNVSPDYGSIIQDTHICLSGDGGKSICKGDSGGPLMADGVQVGITSFSYKSCEASKPSVFTRLTEFSDWIKANSDVNV